MPARLWAILAAMIASFGASAANAQQLSAQARLNNYSHQSLVCSLYYTVAAQCIKNRGDSESIKLGDRYSQFSKDMTDESYQIGRLAGVSDKALVARAQIESRSMIGDIEEKCVNIAVLNLKHGLSCKKFIESREAELDSILNQMRSGQ